VAEEEAHWEECFNEETGRADGESGRDGGEAESKCESSCGLSGNEGTSSVMVDHCDNVEFLVGTRKA